MVLGMIGLRCMGAPMVRRLLRAGKRCIVDDLHPETVHAPRHVADGTRSRGRSDRGRPHAAPRP